MHGVETALLKLMHDTTETVNSRNKLLKTMHFPLELNRVELCSIILFPLFYIRALAFTFYLSIWYYKP